MSTRKQTGQTDRVRREILVACRVLYPAPLRGFQIRHALLAVFPDLEWAELKRRLAGLVESGHVQRIIADSEPDARLTVWAKRWFRLTAAGVEAADRCLEDRALAV